MGSKLSSASDSETLAESAATGISGSVGGLNRHHRHHHYHGRHHASSNSVVRSRARSISGLTHREPGTTHSAALDIDVGGLLDLERPRSRSVIAAGSVPVRVFSFGIQCPVCKKIVQPEDAQCHLVICLTKPQVIYNDDVLIEDKGECVICLDDLRCGDAIARLPCLCVYHKSCIDEWFKVSRSCPEHPGD